MHPRTIAIVTGAVSVTALVLINRFLKTEGAEQGFIVTSFFVVCVLWLSVIMLADKLLKKVYSIDKFWLPLLLFTCLSCLGLLTLVEWDALKLALTIFTGLSVGFIFYTAGMQGSSQLWLRQKPLRRMLMLLWVFDAYALSTTIYGINLFFPRVPFWILTILLGASFAYIANMIWRMYFQFTWKKGSLWILLMALIMIELVWVMHLLPYGYLAAGLLVTWIWYVLQLLTRFHFSPRDVIWKKQVGFLISNLFFYALVMIFFVRWI